MFYLIIPYGSEVADFSPSVEYPWEEVAMQDTTYLAGTIFTRTSPSDIRVRMEPAW